MMNMFRRLRRKKGFTLTELIVSVAIIALLMACVAAFAQPVRSMMTGVRADSDSLKICEVIGNYLERRVAYADMVEVYAGYSITDDAVKAKFSGLSSTATTKTDAKYTKGMLVMHLVKSPDGDDKNSFVLYDVPIKTGSTIPASTTALEGSNYNVFLPEFYSSYQFFMTTDEKMGGTETEPHFMNSNNVTHKAFFSFNILGYKFKEAGKGIDDTTVKSHYTYINGTDTTMTSDPIEDLISNRTAVENVSFTFENISIGQDNNTGLYNDYVGSNQIDIHRKDTDTDLIIFYTVKTYKSSDITK